MEWILIAIIGVGIFSAKNIGTWIRFSFQYACNFSKLQGIEVTNLNGSKMRLIMVLGALTVLPDNVLELIKKQNLSIIYSKSKEDFHEGNYSGFFNSEENFILIYDDGLLGNWGWQVSTILHEIGHFVDYSMGCNSFLSCTDSHLHTIFNGENKYYERYANGTYFTDNIREYFAESFSEYFLVTTFKQECPYTALYMQTVIEIIE